MRKGTVTTTDDLKSIIFKEPNVQEDAAEFLRRIFDTFD